MSNIITDMQNLEQVYNFIQNNEVIALDIETNSLNPRKGLIIGFGISNGTEGYYLTHLTWNGEALEEVLPKSVLKEVLQKLETKQLVAWNFSFDSRFILHYFGVNLIKNLWSDGMLAKHTCDENATNYKLKDTAKEVYGEEAAKEQEDMKLSIKNNGGTEHELFKADLELIAKYCIQDCKLTYNLNAMYINQIEKENLSKFYFEEEVMPLYKHVTIPMELKGIPLDLPKLNAVKKEIESDIFLLEIKIQELIKPHLNLFEDWFYDKEYPEKKSGPFIQTLAELLKVDLPKTSSGSMSMAAKNIASLPDCFFKNYFTGSYLLPTDIKRQVQKKMHGDSYCFNLSSKHHLKKLFFDTLKIEPTSFTDKNNPQVDEKFLNSIKNDVDFVPLLIEYNSLKKLEGTYIDRFINDNENGIYYPSFFQHRTTSGRYGSNLQQLPKPYEVEDLTSRKCTPLEYKYNNIIRELFISGSGYKFLDADYTSLEVVVFADDAGDENLINMIKNNEDFYSGVAIEVYNLQSEFSANKKANNFLKNLRPSLRDAAKVYGLGIRYGMKPYKLSKTLNISEIEAKNIIEKYFTNFPKLNNKMQQYLYTAKNSGFLISKAGRKRRFPELVQIYQKHGDIILDALELWKTYNSSPSYYSYMKMLRKKYNNMLNNALNFPIQSMAASIVNQASIAIAKWLADLEHTNGSEIGYICLNVHDQIVIRCKDEYVLVVKEKMKYLMENTIKLDAPLTADPQVGYNLKDTH